MASSTIPTVKSILLGEPLHKRVAGVFQIRNDRNEWGSRMLRLFEVPATRRRAWPRPAVPAEIAAFFKAFLRI
jgi:hypothetical protein